MSRMVLLRLLIVADAVLAWSVIGIEALFHKTLPPSLRDYVVAQFFTPDGSGLWNVTLFAMWFASLMGFCVAWIGLFLTWRPARPIYLVSWFLALATLAAGGPSVLTAPGAIVDTVGNLVSGAVIGLVYASDLRERFEERRSGVMVTITP